MSAAQETPAAVTLPLHDATQWPLRMTRDEVAHVTRRSTRTLHTMLKAGAFPMPGSDRMWARAQVVAYLEGDIDRYRHSQRIRAGQRKAAATGGGRA